MATGQGFLKGQGLGLVALLLVLTTGAAYAVAAKNSVVSSSIKNGQVKTKDLADGAVVSAKLGKGAVTGAEVVDGSLTGADVADGSLTGDDIADGTVGSAHVSGLTGADVAADSLGGADIDESSLGTVGSAHQAGTGRYQAMGSCDPESTTYAGCASLTNIPMFAPGRLLVIGSVQASTESDSDLMNGSCELYVDGTVVPGTRVDFLDRDEGDDHTVVDTAPLIAVTGTLSAGNHAAVILCNQWSSGAITYPAARVAAVVLSNG
jgi:hypothetical protein